MRTVLDHILVLGFVEAITLVSSCTVILFVVDLYVSVALVGRENHALLKTVLTSCMLKIIVLSIIEISMLAEILWVRDILRLLRIN